MDMVDKPIHTSNSSRRRFFKTAGTAGAVLLAGCSGGNMNGENEGNSSGSGGNKGNSSGNGGNGQQGNNVLIGHLAPFSGGLGWAGEDARKGIETAIEDINSAGLLGREVEYTRQDTETTPQAALQGFETLNSQDVTAIVGPASSSIMNVTQPAIDAGVAMITPFASTSQLDDVHSGYIWRMVSSDSVAPRFQARYAMDQGWDKVARAYKNAQGPQSFSQAFEGFFTDMGGEITTAVNLDPDADSYSSEIEQILNSDPKAVSIIAGTEVTELFVKNYRQRGGEHQLLVSDDVATPELIDRLGEAVEGLIAQSAGTTENYDEFAQRFKDVHGESPGTWPHTAYDSMNVIALALQNTGEISRDAVADNLREIGNPPGTEVTTFSQGKEELENGNGINYEGAGSNANFDDKGNVISPHTIIQVQDGEWVTLEEIKPKDL